MPPYRLARLVVSLLPLALAVCDKREDARSERAPPPPPLPAATSRADICAGGGGQDTDTISAPFVPRAAGGYCIDPQSEPKTYGDKGKLSMDDVCTTAIDGECEEYKRLGLDRVVVLRYVDGAGAPNSVEVNLSRFKSADGAYAMFTKRVVADGDPAAASVKPLAAGAAAATSSSNAYVFEGQYLAELTFVTEDTKMTPEAMAQANERATGAIAKEIGARLPGPPGVPAAVTMLPEASRLPLGVSYHPKDALGLKGVGPLAIGYYKEGDKRWRVVAIVRPDVEAAKEAFRAFKLEKGSLPLKDVRDEAVLVVLQEAPDRAKAEYAVGRKGTLVVGVGDEELVLDPATPTEKLVPLKLTRQEKLSRLYALLK